MTRDSAHQLVILPPHYQEKKALESFKDAVLWENTTTGLLPLSPSPTPPSGRPAWRPEEP